MGLAAGQARLLTITGRKSDCEYESMRLSHQKLALSRQLTDISNEYQNSLDQTKLIYDYYGTGDESNPLTYGILMNPSALNGYMPTLVTDPKGRTVLNSKYAAAASAAGIPQEGFGTLPSESVRNSFIQALAKEDIITDKVSSTIQSLPYNQAAGLGGGTTTAVQTTTGNLDDLIKYMDNQGMTVKISLDSSATTDVPNGEFKLYTNNDKDISGGGSQSFSLGKLLKGDETASLYIYSNKTGDQKHGPASRLISYATSTIDDILDQVGDYMADLFDLGDTYSAQALDYAKNSIQGLYKKADGKDPNLDHDSTDLAFQYKKGDRWSDGDTNSVASGYIGWVAAHYHKSNHNRSKATININNILQAYMTYYVDFVNGISKTDSKGNDLYNVKLTDVANKEWQRKSESKLVTDDSTYQYTWKIGSSISSDDTALATFYDALFNQICLNGWTANNNIDDSEYLQQMLKNGMLFISKTSDDGYYYQGNYATDTYIKEIADNTKIAQAEAKYNTEKAKLNAKEETLDLKMKNLDTEISSLTTEYDTIKNTISKNIEKSFKRYNA